MRSLPRNLVAVDIGNSSAKTVLHRVDDSTGTYGPAEVVHRVENPGDWDRLELPPDAATWAVSSVHAPRAASLRDWLAERRPDDELVELTWRDVPLPHDFEAPERVGLDRWMGCYAATRMWGAETSGVVVLAGTAITVNLIRKGVFAGGAILPGFDMALHSLHRGTDKLPDLTGRLPEELEPLPGRDTASAIRAGVGWGAVGAVREIGTRMTEGLDNPQWFFSGGNAAMLAKGFGRSCFAFEALTLTGVEQVFRELCESSSHGAHEGG